MEVADQIVGSGFSSTELRNKAMLDAQLLLHFIYKVFSMKRLMNKHVSFSLHYSNKQNRQWSFKKLLLPMPQPF